MSNLSFELNGEDNFTSISVQSVLFSFNFQYLASFAISKDKQYNFGPGRPIPPFSVGDHNSLNLIMAFFLPIKIV